MKSQSEKKEKKEEEEKKDENSDGEEENEENEETEDIPGVKLDQFITTPYERVLSIINEAKAFIKSVSKDQQALIKGLEWAIKVISSHSLYAYELKDQEYLNQVSEDNPDFKQFVDFVNSYNDEVIEMNKKTDVNDTNGKKSFQKSSLKLKRANTMKNSKDNIKEEDEEEVNKSIDKDKNKNNKKKNNLSKNKKNKTNIVIDVKKSRKTSEKKNNINTRKNFKSPPKKVSLLKKFKNNFAEKIQKIQMQKTENNINTEQKILPQAKSTKNVKNNKPNSNARKRASEGFRSSDGFSPQVRKSQTMIFSSDGKKKKSGSVILEKVKADILNIQPIELTKYTSVGIERALKNINYNTSKILDKSFNIFELKELIGQDNVLPIMGKTILEAFGLYSDDIISTQKLDPFLVSVSNQYLHSTLYHNSLHGADVTQSVCLYFLNSNAEEVCQSLVLDVLGILIAALGHDLAHPGYTNPFHINSSSELAITYNDASCLENFHASKLFRTIRNPETDIFEKLQVPDYKTIRKRMIGNILATDMANHGKIMTVIKSRISLNMTENKKQFELLSGNEKTKFEEQQSLFDFLIHAADLAHNTKPFSISLKWVELLSEEFWLQGDKEKSLNLPVSFLCDRDNYNIPNSQVGFIKGFIIPTFETLINAFPTLKYALNNAKINLKKWQNLSNKKRLKGWTPEKTKQINYKKKLSLFSVISFAENIKLVKRKSGMINSLSHELQIKDDGKENERFSTENQKSNKTKIHRPNIILKTKNHDKKIHINKFQKLKK